MLRVHNSRVVHIRLAERADLPHVRSCLAEAFEPERADYTPAMFENTVPTIDAAPGRSASASGSAPSGMMIER
jgi:hypothetical protein